MMSIFSTPLGQLSTADLAELLTERAVENVRLEFKREVPGKDETLKKLSAFANTFGGYLVVGAAADSKHGRLDSLPGVEEKSGYRQSIVQWCFDSVFPPIEIEVSDPIPVPGNPDKVCYVVHVGESENSPHFLNGRKGIWVRTSEFSARFEAQLANETEIRQLLNRRQVVRDRRSALLERARGRFRTFTNRRYQDLTGKQQIGCTLEFSVVPRFPAQPLCDHAHLHTIVQKLSVPWRRTGFPEARQSLIAQHESVIVLRPVRRFSMLEANIWGMVFYTTEIEDREQHYKGIHHYNFLGDVLVFMEHARLFLAHVGYAGPLRIDVTLHRLIGAPWVYADRTGAPEAGPSSELDDQVSFHIDATTSDLAARRDALAIDVMRLVFLATNWKDITDSPEKLENLRRKGYEYNSWQI